MDTHWSLGVLIGLPLTILILLVCAGIVVTGIRVQMSADAYSGDGGLIAAFFAGFVFLVVLGFALSPLGFYPYSAQYHQWQHHGGTVTSVSDRLLKDGDGMSQKFVVTFSGSSQQYGCNDTRCASVKVGDTLDLSCKRTWQYAGTDGYDCNFVALRKGNS